MWVCFINPAFTQGRFYVLPRKVSLLPRIVACEENWLRRQQCLLTMREKSAKGLVSLWTEGPNGKGGVVLVWIDRAMHPSKHPSYPRGQGMKPVSPPYKTALQSRLAMLD
jgi:hypothetical protein